MGEIVVDLGKADWLWDEELQMHIPCCRMLTSSKKCGNGPLTGQQIWSGCCNETHWSEPATPVLIEEGVRLECRGEGCAASITLPYVNKTSRFNREVSIEGMTGWTVPPILCPACSAKKEATEQFTGFTTKAFEVIARDEERNINYVKEVTDEAP